MKRLLSIFFLSLLLVQAIPVLHFFSSQKSSLYAVLDEEKPAEKSDVEKKEGKEFLSFIEAPAPFSVAVRRSFNRFFVHSYSSPSLDALTPPPDC